MIAREHLQTSLGVVIVYISENQVMVNVSIHLSNTPFKIYIFYMQILYLQISGKEIEIKEKIL